jgi:hypothetical protein
MSETENKEFKSAWKEDYLKCKPMQMQVSSTYKTNGTMRI